MFVYWWYGKCFTLHLYLMLCFSVTFRSIRIKDVLQSGFTKWIHESLQSTPWPLWHPGNAGIVAYQQVRFKESKYKTILVVCPGMAYQHINISGISISMIQRIKVHRQDCLLHSDKVNCYLHEYFPHWNICQVLLELRGTCKWKFRSWKCPDFQDPAILLSGPLFLKSRLLYINRFMPLLPPEIWQGNYLLSWDNWIASRLKLRLHTYLSSMHFQPYWVRSVIW